MPNKPREVSPAGWRGILSNLAMPTSGTVTTAAMDADYADASSLTILVCVDQNASAAKRFRPDRNGTLIASKTRIGSYFAAIVIPHITNLSRLATAIDEFSRNQRSYVVRSKPLPTANRQRMRRRLHSRPDQPATLAEPSGGYHWFMVDFDSVETGDIDPVTEPERAIGYAIHNLLPELFHDVAFYWQLSGSAGIKPGLRAHTFFWASRPVTSAELKALLHGFSVDLNVYSPAQPIYIANPIFARGTVDPVPRRSGLCEGLPVVQLPDAVIIPSAKPNAARESGGAGLSPKVDFGPGFENKLAQLGDGRGLSGFHRPLLAATAAYAYENGSTFDRAALKQRLRAAIGAAPTHPDREQDIARYTSDQYLDDIIQSAVDKYASPLVEPTYPAPILSPSDARAKIDAGISCHIRHVERREKELVAWDTAYGVRDKLLWAPLRLSLALHFRSLRPGLFSLPENEGPEMDVDPQWLQTAIDALKEQYAAAMANIEEYFPDCRKIIDAAPLSSSSPLAVERAPMPPPVDAIAADVGLGKTSKWMSQVATIPGAVISGPRHDLGDELAEKLAKQGVKMAVYRGLGADDPDAPGEKMCRDLKRAEAVIGAGLKLSEKACGSSRIDSECQFRSVCGYQRQRERKPDVWLVPHNLLAMEKPSFIPEVTSLTIDETFYGVGLRGLELKAEDRPSVAISDIAPSIEGYSCNERLRRRLETMPDGYIPAEVIAAAGVTPSSCDFASHSIWKDKDGAKNLKPGVPWDKAERILIDAETNNKLVYALADFWRLVSQSLKQGGVSPYLRIVGGRIYMQWRRDIHASWLTGAVMLLDATMPEFATRKYFPRLGNVEPLRVKMPFVRVRQITDTAMSMTALIADKHASKEKNRERAANIVRLNHYIVVRAARRKKVLVITYKGIEKELRVPDCVTVAHFGAITGMDTWGDVDLLIVIGRTEPSPTNVENITRTVHAKDIASIAADANGNIRYSRVNRGIRLRRPGNGVTVRNSAHPDPDVEELRWFICEGGLLQAIGRGRGVNRDENSALQVDILTNVALPIVVDEALTWRAIMPTRIEVAAALAKANALPLSDAELARCFPDLWRSTKAVENERVREIELSRENRVRAVWGGAALLHATYRRTVGRGGQASRALISAVETDPRAALEAVVDPVLEFSLD